MVGKGQGAVCILCAIDYCDNCTAEGICQDCQGEYNLVEGLCLQGCPANCAAGSCNEYVGVCFACETSYTLNIVLNQCFSCGVANCLTCSANNFCSECTETFYPNSNGVCICPTGSTLQNNGTNCGCPAGQTFNPTSTGTSGICNLNCGITNCINCANGV